DAAGGGAAARDRPPDRRRVRAGSRPGAAPGPQVPVAGGVPAAARGKPRFAAGLPPALPVVPGGCLRLPDLGAGAAGAPAPRSALRRPFPVAARPARDGGENVMSRARTALGIALALALVGAAPGPDPEALLREGNEAFARGDFARAAALYEKAEVRATDPG